MKFKSCIPVIVGPTASGKTGLSIRVARFCNGEIVSADSRQIYTHLTIGTAKPSPEEMEGIPHHCMDFLDPAVDFSAGEFAQTARRKIEEIQGRNHCPVVAGGSGLYIRALIDGMFTEDVRDDAVRAALRKQAEEEGIQPLFEELRQGDPASAKAIHPHNVKRVLRALEIVRITGQSRSALWTRNPPSRPFRPLLFGLYWPREPLYQRINDRVDRMIADGLIEEAASLTARGYDPELNSLNTLGYKEVFAFLNHEIDQATMRKQIQKNTRRFAKRQMTWFRNDRRIHWIPMHQQRDPDRIAQYIHCMVSSQNQ